MSGSNDYSSIQKRLFALVFTELAISAFGKGAAREK